MECSKIRQLCCFFEGEEEKTPINFVDMSTTKGRMLQYFQLQALRFMMGGDKQKAVKTYKSMRNVLTLKPEHVFFIKALALLSSGSANSASGSGYPMYGHVSTELSLLFSRLAQTPDMKKSLTLNRGVKYPSQWTKVQMIDVSELMSKAVFPGILKDLANVVKVPVEENEIQEMRDRKGKPLTQMQKLYSQIGMT